MDDMMFRAIFCNNDLAAVIYSNEKEAKRNLEVLKKHHRVNILPDRHIGSDVYEKTYKWEIRTRFPVIFTEQKSFEKEVVLWDKR